MAWSTVFMDGADYYTASADVRNKWGYAGGSPTGDTSIKREAGGSLRLPSSSHYVGRGFPAARNVIVGFAFHPIAPGATALNTTGAAFVVFGDSESPADTAAHQMVLGLLVDGSLHAVRGSSNMTFGSIGGTTLGSSAATSIASEVWRYVEVRMFIDNTAGVVEVRVDGVAVLHLTGQDTQNLASNTLKGLHLRTNSSAYYYDDVYVRTSDNMASEEVADGFLGDIRIRAYLPAADGTYSDFTPSSGADNYAMVDEASPNTTDYNFSSTAGHKDSFTMATVPELGTIKGVQLNVYAVKESSGFRGIDLLARVGTTDYYGSASQLSTSYLPKLTVWENNPDTAAAWTEAEINAAQFGYRISS